MILRGGICLLANQSQQESKKSESLKLEEAANLYFSEFVKPEIEKISPDIFNYAGVQITSSVAYGFADQFSDLDMFLIFKEHKQYLKYRQLVEDAVNNIVLPDGLRFICDKGMRLEIESLKKSGLLDLVNDIEDINSWLRQEEWLLFWFNNAIILEDKTGWISNLKSCLNFYPNSVKDFKYYNALDDLYAYYLRLKNYVNKKDTWSYFLYSKYFFRCAYLLMKLVYWRNQSFIPHGKWIYKGVSLVSKEGQELSNDLIDILTNKKSVHCLEYWINKLKAQDKEFKKNLNQLYGSTIYDTKSNMAWIVIPKESEINNFSKNRWRNLLGIPSDCPISLSFDHGFYLGDQDIECAYSKYMEVDARLIELCIKRKNELRILNGKEIKMFYPQKEVYNKKLKYLLFIIWRKIRVIKGAYNRGNLFNMNWYSTQVFEHIIELSLALNHKLLPSPELLKSSVEKLMVAGKVIDKLIESGPLFWDSISEEDVERDLMIYWEAYYSLGEELINEGVIDKGTVEWPLPMQFDLEYWKYENRSF